MIPPNRWLDAPPAGLDRLDGPGPAFTPWSEDAIEPLSVQRRLTRYHIDVRVLDPLPRPWNPLAKANPFFRGVDPLRAMRLLTRARAVDAVVSIFESGGLMPLLLRPVTGYRPKIVLWDASVGNDWRPLQWIQRRVMPRYDGLMMLTTNQIREIEARYRLAGEPFHLGYNVDERFFEAGRLDDGAGAGPGTLLSVGDDLSRDYQTLWRAIEGLDLGMPVVLKTRWRPRHAADGDATAGESRVRFISERLDDRAFRSLYGEAAIVALPLHDTAHAGGITSLFEAMSMGRAIVTSDAPTVRDFVTDGRDALVTPVGDAEAMRSAIRRLASDEPLRRRLGAAARETIVRRWSTDALAARMAGFLWRLCRGVDAPPEDVGGTASASGASPPATVQAGS